MAPEERDVREARLLQYKERRQARLTLSDADQSRLQEQVLVRAHPEEVYRHVLHDRRLLTTDASLVCLNPSAIPRRDRRPSWWTKPRCSAPYLSRRPVALSHPPVGLGWVQAVWLSLAAGSCTRQLWRPVRDEIVAGVLCIYGDAMVIRRAPGFAGPCLDSLV